MDRYNNLSRIAILCGGTGGHFFPGLSIARKCAENGGRACLITGGHKKDYQKQAASKYGIDFFEVSSSKFSRNPAVLLKFAFNLARGYIQSLWIFQRFKPDAVIGMGSFTSLPASFAAITLRIPLYLHDGNALTGKSNVFLSRFARLLMNSFPPVRPERIKCRVEVTGLPVRQELLDSKYTKALSINVLNSNFRGGFSADNPTILIFGGSQGAKTLNRIVPEAILSAQKEMTNGKLKIENEIQTVNQWQSDKVHSDKEENGIGGSRKAGEEYPAARENETADCRQKTEDKTNGPANPANPHASTLSTQHSTFNIQPSTPCAAWQVIHLTGKTMLRETKEFYDINGIKNLVFESFENMAIMYSASDFVICRSGGSTIAELSLFRKPALLIPFPGATDNHQFYNAKYYLESGIAEMLEDAECTADKIAAILTRFIVTLPGSTGTSGQIDLAVPDSAGKILSLIDRTNGLS